MSANFGGEPLASPSPILEETLLAYKLYTPEPIAPPADKDAIRESSSPLVICFHGSGESCSPSWDALTRALTAPPLRLRVLAVDRGPAHPKPPQATADLLAHLAAGGDATRPPYVLVAHSYGGAFARTFLEETGGKRVAGVVLVETGQEGGLDGAVEDAQYRRRALGRRPLSVVRGNSLLGVEAQIAAAEARATSEVETGALRRRREMLRVWDGEDERLKRRQLELSETTAPKRYVCVNDCGHDVVRDRPDLVAGEVKWVVENIGEGGDGDEAGGDKEGVREERGVGGEDEDKGEGEAERGERGWRRIRRIYKEMFGMLFGRLRGLR
ncbi:Alpha/Beta hydrolase protein [Hypoxylon cercidicola]|nr:Alpha/Beta hydrolase protein [Hypoxylon cercidicola]